MAKIKLSAGAEAGRPGRGARPSAVVAALPVVLATACTTAGATGADESPEVVRTSTGVLRLAPPAAAPGRAGDTSPGGRHHCGFPPSERELAAVTFPG